MQHPVTASRFTLKPIGKSSRKKRGTLSGTPTLANARSRFNLAPNLHSVSARLADCSCDARLWTRDGVLATPRCDFRGEPERANGANNPSLFEGASAFPGDFARRRGRKRWPSGWLGVNLQPGKASKTDLIYGSLDYPSSFSQDWRSRRRGWRMLLHLRPGSGHGRIPGPREMPHAWRYRAGHPGHRRHAGLSGQSGGPGSGRVRRAESIPGKWAATGTGSCSWERRDGCMWIASDWTPIPPRCSRPRLGPTKCRQVNRASLKRTLPLVYYENKTKTILAYCALTSQFITGFHKAIQENGGWPLSNHAVMGHEPAGNRIAHRDSERRHHSSAACGPDGAV